jgi:CspA family cold shock protein
MAGQPVVAARLAHCASGAFPSDPFALHWPAIGSIARLVRDRGFGFIKTESGKDLFFYTSAVTGGLFDTLQEGQTVTYDREADPRGRGDRAVNGKVA